MKYHVYKWNKREKEFTMIVLTEEDVEKESRDIFGAGYEILVLPNKYKDVHSNYLDTARMMATVRRGEVIYV